ncbi:carbohydrate kinase [Lysinibacillus sp. KU-BSD001]|uniref:carbohydrate kinase family protein n=1 Tax=Lysinibacillus sp. KU-BSD001 TaxID=3141328 RepID=UPI0036F17646
MKTILCIGELLIDFFCAEMNVNLVEATHFQKQAGGAPANVCATIAKLGGQAKFCGKVGNDAFGAFLEKTLVEAGVNTAMLVKGQSPTTLAFVSRISGGERDFIFNRGADETLVMSEIDRQELNVEIAHFGSATALLSSPFYDTYMEVMHMLKKRGAFISFDPNFRADLWTGREEVYRERVAACVALADFIKMSEEEFELYGGQVPLGKWFAVTKGQEGTWISNGEECALIPSIHIQAIDTTGAGDAFVGAMLKQFADYPTLKVFNFQHFKQLTQFSNIVGALTCTAVGAMTALPTTEDVVLYMNNKK